MENTIYALDEKCRVAFMCDVFIGGQRFSKGGLDAGNEIILPGCDFVCILSRGLGK